MKFTELEKKAVKNDFAGLKKEVKQRKCPRCGATEKQRKNGIVSRAQRYLCGACGKAYSLIGESDRKMRYSDDFKRNVVEAYRSGIEAKDISKQFHISSTSVYEWSKKYDGN